MSVITMELESTFDEAHLWPLRKALLERSKPGLTNYRQLETIFSG